MTVSRTVSIDSSHGHIDIASDGGSPMFSRDYLITSSYVSGSDNLRRISLTIDPQKAQDLIELLTEYIEYRKEHPLVVRE